MKDYIDKGLIKENIHPYYPELAIYNYTPECQFSKAWDETTLAARGLILNRHTGEVIAKPWPKFFNLSEHDSIPGAPALVQEKMDGSLGIVFHYDDKWHIATRGSFTSEQALKAQQWIAGHDFPKGYTHLFEIIYPQNRIVVDYDGFEGLVYLESLCLAQGKPHDIVAWPHKAKSFGCVHPQDLLKHKDNAEGYVLYWPEQGLRVKVKFDEYVRLHKIMTEYSIKRLWEHLSAGGDFNAMIAGVPDEFYAEVSRDRKKLLDAYDGIYEDAAKTADTVQDMPTRKEQAVYVMQHNKDLSGIVFKLLDDRGVKEAIWRKVKEWLNF